MRQRTLYVFGFSFLLFIVSAVIRYQSFGKMRAYTQSVNHSREIITSLDRLSNYFKSAQIYSPRYEVKVAQNFYGLYRQEALKVNSELNELLALTKDNPVQARQMESLAQLIDAQMPVLLEMNIPEMIEAGEGWRLGQLFKISSMINTMAEAEEKELNNRKQVLEKTIHWNNIISLTLVIIAGGTILVTFATNLLLNRKQKWLEGFLESILNAAQNGIVSYKAVHANDQLVDFTIEYANETVEKLLGYKPQELIGKKVSALPNILGMDSMVKFRTVVEKREPVEYETHFTQNEVRRWFLVRLAPREEGFTATIQDITGLKNAQEKLETSVQQLEKSNAALEQYAYAASHDLQEPLRKIQTFSNLLWDRQSDQLDEKGKQYLQKVVNSSERMSTLIRDILSYSSISQGAVFVSTNLNDELNNVLQDLELMIEQKGARIHTHPLPTVEAIPLQMRQLLYNLVNNALKFTQEGRLPEITISARPLSPEEVQAHSQLNPPLDYTEIQVSDNGIGFNNEYTGQIFSLFKRLNSKDEFDGSGIGLALCQKVVENHNGVIYARGKVGYGASFFIILPTTHPVAL